MKKQDKAKVQSSEERPPVPRHTREQSVTEPAKGYPSPRRLLMVTTVSIFVGEALVMLLLAILPPLPTLVQALFDAVMLSVLVFPIPYLFLYRPLILHITARKRAEEMLQKSHHEVEIRVNERTADLLAANNALRHEITERERAEAALRAMNEELREARHYLSRLIEGSTDAIISTNQEGNVVLFNKGAESMLGYSRQEVIGQRVTAIYEDEERAKEVMRQMRQQGGTVAGIETILRAKDGSHVPVLISASILYDAEAQEAGTVGFNKDLRERQRAEAALARSTEELARSNAELEQFAYVASHDLQEPVRMVASYTKLLAERYKDKLDADASEFIGYALDGATRMQALIKDLLAYSRVGSAGKDFKSTNAEAILEQVLVNLKVPIEESEAMITHDPLPTVRADASQLGQVFQNLIGNAIKFRGEVPPLIHVGVERKDGEWLFRVQDNGIGLDPQFTEQIFVLFQRLHGSAGYRGTGIGLAICKKIVEGHGGRIWVESQPNQGATFYFTIPRKE